MTHKNEDELLAFALEVVPTEKERAGIAKHLETCSECRAHLESIRKDIGVIAGVRPSTAVLPALEGRPSVSAARTGEGRAHRLPGYALLRAAALVAVGIVVGFGAGSRVSREPVFVSSAYVETSPTTAPSEGTAVSDATGVPDAYYEQIVN